MPVMICTVEPEEMSTQTPTRNNCANRWAWTDSWHAMVVNMGRHMERSAPSYRSRLFPTRTSTAYSPGAERSDYARGPSAAQ
eukprot:scaffold22164_cov68-Phaeocystis_antarctica.AAC.5